MKPESAGCEAGTAQENPSEQTKKLPWDVDWSKSFYERTYVPGRGPYPDSFAKIEEQYVAGFDQSVRAGDMLTTIFPIQTVLYLNSAISVVDAAYLRDLFWSQRWRRYLAKLSPWALAALGPPTVVFLSALLLRWIGAGFRGKLS